MKGITKYALGTVLVLGVSSAAWAQQRDLEVTMDVVPANAPASAAGEIKLPFALPESASPRGELSSSFGRGIAERAQQGDLGRDFGQDVSAAARDQSRTPNFPPQSKRP